MALTHTAIERRPGNGSALDTGRPDLGVPAPERNTVEESRRSTWLVTLLLLGAILTGGGGAYLLAGDWLREMQYRGDVPALVAEPDEAQAVAARRLVPNRIVIDAAGVNTIVEPAAATYRVNRFTGAAVSTFPVPGGPFTTVWWEEGPAPGEDGLAVILGHTRGESASVFADLPGLQAGDIIGLIGTSPIDNQTVARYHVADVVTGIAKSDEMALRHVLDNAPEGASLALITCSGDVHKNLSSHTDNTVVFATLEGMYSPSAPAQFRAGNAQP